jgi:hypothetical protein
MLHVEYKKIVMIPLITGEKHAWKARREVNREKIGTVQVQNVCLWRQLLRVP